jgi:hypothetical protein
MMKKKYSRVSFNYKKGREPKVKRSQGHFQKINQTDDAAVNLYSDA